MIPIKLEALHFQVCENCTKSMERGLFSHTHTIAETAVAVGSVPDHSAPPPHTHIHYDFSVVNF